MTYNNNMTRSAGPGNSVGYRGGNNVRTGGNNTSGGGGGYRGGMRNNNNGGGGGGGIQGSNGPRMSNYQPQAQVVQK